MQSSAFLEHFVAIAVIVSYTLCKQKDKTYEWRGPPSVCSSPVCKQDNWWQTDTAWREVADTASDEAISTEPHPAPRSHSLLKTMCCCLLWVMGRWWMRKALSQVAPMMALPIPSGFPSGTPQTHNPASAPHILPAAIIPFHVPLLTPFTLYFLLYPGPLLELS